MLLIASGCSDEGKTVAETAGTRVGETLTDFASGVGEGVDTRMEVTVELSPQCAELGLSKTVAKSLGIKPVAKSLDMKQGISVYFIAEKPFTGHLVCKATNKDGQEVGRVKVDVEFEADDAKYVTFPFDAEMDSQLVTSYTVDARVGGKAKPPAAESAPAAEPAQGTETEKEKEKE
jgi:hypothetical protein